MKDECQWKQRNTPALEKLQRLLNEIQADNKIVIEATKNVRDT
jgi:hypothetical protein